MTNTTLDKVEQFIKTFKLPKRMARGVLRCDKDCQLFYSDFYRRNRNVASDLIEFRLYKISQSDITLESFVSMCKSHDLKDVFEMTFLEAFDLQDLIFVNKAIEEGRTTYANLYKSFKENPNQRIISIIL